MNINKALGHFEWKLKNTWKPTEKDIEAYNAILEWKELQESINLTKNENLAKLWIHQLILLNETEMYSAERAIQVIDEILSKSVYDWCVKLQSQANIMRFKSILATDEYKLALKELKPIKMRDIGSSVIEEKQDELKKTLNNLVDVEKIIKFVEKEITRIEE